MARMRPVLACRSYHLLLSMVRTAGCNLGLLGCCCVQRCQNTCCCGLGVVVFDGCSPQSAGALFLCSWFYHLICAWFLHKLVCLRVNTKGAGPEGVLLLHA
jgi:hypothetical protein